MKKTEKCQSSDIGLTFATNISISVYPVKWLIKIDTEGQEKKFFYKKVFLFVLSVNYVTLNFADILEHSYSDFYVYNFPWTFQKHIWEIFSTKMFKF